MLYYLPDSETGIGTAWGQGYHILYGGVTLSAIDTNTYDFLTSTFHHRSTICFHSFSQLLLLCISKY